MARFPLSPKQLEIGNLTLFLAPTMKGLQIVNKKPSHGRGGAVHRHFQEGIANHARGLGYQADIEHRLPDGGDVDVHLAREGTRVGVEIAIHSKPGKELHNIRKCLAAGYDKVLALYLDSDLLQRTRDLFTREATEEERQKVSFLEVGTLAEELK